MGAQLIYHVVDPAQLICYVVVYGVPLLLGCCHVVMLNAGKCRSVSQLLCHFVGAALVLSSCVMSGYVVLSCCRFRSGS